MLFIADDMKEIFVNIRIIMNVCILGITILLIYIIFNSYLPNSNFENNIPYAKIYHKTVTINLYENTKYDEFEEFLSSLDVYVDKAYAKRVEINASLYFGNDENVFDKDILKIPDIENLMDVHLYDLNNSFNEVFDDIDFIKLNDHYPVIINTTDKNLKVGQRGILRVSSTYEGDRNDFGSQTFPIYIVQINNIPSPIVELFGGGYELSMAEKSSNIAMTNGLLKELPPYHIITLENRSFLLVFSEKPNDDILEKLSEYGMIEKYEYTKRIHNQFVRSEEITKLSLFGLIGTFLAYLMLVFSLSNNIDVKLQKKIINLKSRILFKTVINVVSHVICFVFNMLLNRLIVYILLFKGYFKLSIIIGISLAISEGLLIMHTIGRRKRYLMSTHYKNENKQERDM